MTAALIYIIKWAALLTLFHSAYGLLLRRETLHSVNRAVLLAIMGAAMVLPLCHVPTAEPSPIAEAAATAETFIIEQAYGGPQPAAGTAAPAHQLALWPRVLAMAYVAGLAASWLAYLRSLASLWLLIARGRRPTGRARQPQPSLNAPRSRARCRTKASPPTAPSTCSTAWRKQPACTR